MTLCKNPVAAWPALSLSLLGGLALADVKNFSGAACPVGYAPVTVAEAAQKRETYCSYLPPSAITRLVGKASLSGSASNCALNADDGRGTDTVLCKSVSSPTRNGFEVVQGAACPDNSVVASYNDVAADPTAICAAMGRWDIARLANQGQPASISGSGYGCKLLPRDARELGSRICKPAQNKVYVEVNNSDLANVGCFRKGNGDPVFDVAMIFAANINADAEGNATVHLNEQVSDLLDRNLDKVKALQAQGTKVVVTLLNNHQNAGWSCFADAAAADRFAGVVQQFLGKYGLDGVDIDDEYDACTTHYPDSLVKVTTALRSRLGSRIISKALWSDIPHFSPRYLGQQLGDQLSYGLEMSYDTPGNCMSRIQAYLDVGVDRGKLGVGASTALTSTGDAAALDRCIAANQLAGGMMVFNLQGSSLAYLKSIWPDTTAATSCLR